MVLHFKASSTTLCLTVYPRLSLRGAREGERHKIEREPVPPGRTGTLTHNRPPTQGIRSISGSQRLRKCLTVAFVITDIGCSVGGLPSPAGWTTDQLQAPWEKSSLDSVEKKPSRDDWRGAPGLVSASLNSVFRKKSERRVDAELIVHTGGMRRKAGAS